MRVKCMVAGRNANGEPDFFFVIVRCSDSEFKAGYHYARARRAASAEGYEPALCFDEFDSAGKMLLHHFEWRSASREGFADMYLLRTGDGGGALYLFRDDALKDHNNQCSHAIEVFEHTVPDDVERLVVAYGH